MGWRLCALVAVFLVFLPESAAIAADSSVEARLLDVRPRAHPASDWDEMLKHRSEYLRLKEKFEPEKRMTRIDLDACERDSMLPPGLRPPGVILELRGCPPS